MTIDFDHLPVEPTVTLIDPDGKDLITTNNPIAILYARSEIKLNKWESATFTSTTIIGMLILCWAIYTVYTGESCNL